MGEMSSYYLEQEDPFDPDDTYWRGGRPEPEDGDGPPRHQPTKTIWVTKAGQRIRVRDMADSHLVNTIRYLQRTAPTQMAATEMSLYGYLDSDPPDGAADCAEGALRELEKIDTEEWLSGTCPTFAAMLAEAEKRKLVV